jgi:hypothetical protein
MGGSLALCRIYSRFLALQIKAIEEGLYLQASGRFSNSETVYRVTFAVELPRLVLLHQYPQLSSVDYRLTVVGIDALVD